MGFIDRLKPRLLFKAQLPNLRKFIGRTVLIPCDPKPKKVIIKTIVGNKFKQTSYEINGEYLIGMLRFHAQMEGVKDISEEEFKKFEEMTFEVEKLPPKDEPKHQVERNIHGEKK